MAWQEFCKGKRKKKDVQEFEFDLEDNLFTLHESLKNKTYNHENYSAFNVCDPKLRKIHKAKVRDRVLHHAIFRILYPIFDENFIFDSYSCRNNKGTHAAVRRLEKFLKKASNNNHKKIFALKCDIKKFFESIDQEILLKIMKRRIADDELLWLLEKLIESFSTGLPLGNVTSQLFSNIYLNEFDQFVKHVLKEKYYLRYCDDFIILRENEEDFEKIIFEIDNFLQNKLKLKLHPNKIIIRKYRQGIDFLGYVVLPNHIALRTKTKRRMFKKLKIKKKMVNKQMVSAESYNQSLQSYLGILKHCRGYKIQSLLDT